jgi:tetratricopeptide (TPR) repeat protein
LVSEDIADTVSATDPTAATESGESRPKIRPSQPSLAPSSTPQPDYAGLTVVDPAHYVITREIARGGMGRIQVARDRRLGREVAVKETLAGTGSIARRFEREARITARLQHPSIVSVHEAGTWPSGDPFYAMPLVSGRSLAEVIAAATTPEARIGLVPHVLAIADAMAYAHGERIIHRDLKPRNVVIGAFGETVVIDWGLAKDLRADAPADVADSASGASGASGETSAGDVLGTPAYMPPEQAAGVAVDERADVYAIGAILYHVLAGRAPYQADSQAELLSAVYVGPPQPLAELAPRAAPELIAIAERAMERDVARRYPSARELAEDLRRFQTGQLVGAHRYSTRQLIWRWIVRHRTLIISVGVATAVAVAIGVYALVRIVAAEREADDQRRLAITSKAKAEKTLEFMLFDLHDKLENAGRLDLMDAIGKQAHDYYKDVAASGTPLEQVKAGQALLAIAGVIETRGDLRGALAEYETAQATIEHAASRSGDIRQAIVGLDAENHIGGVLAQMGELDKALAKYRDIDARATQLLPRGGHVAIIAELGIASALEARGDLDAALTEVRTAMTRAEAMVFQLFAWRDVVDKDLLNSHARLGHLLLKAHHDAKGALTEYRRALAIGERLAAADAKSTLWLDDIATSHSEIGQLLLDGHDVAGALAEFRVGAATADRLADHDPTNTHWAKGSSILHERVGMALAAQHELPGAVAEYQKSEAILTKLAARDPDNLDWQRNLSVIENKLGDMELARGDRAAALASFQSALAIREKLVAKSPTNAAWRRDVFYSHIKLVNVHEHEPKLALDEALTALAIADQIGAANPANKDAQWDRATTHGLVANIRHALKDDKGARSDVQAALDIATPFRATDPDWDRLAKGAEAALAAHPKRKH